MQQKRLMWALCAAIAVIALVPVATAMGDDDEVEGTIEAAALGNTFTYQGRLSDGGAPANGAYDLRFILYDAESGGAQVGSTVTREDVNVANGLFTVELDFGASAFTGDARWMEIAVRPGASAGSHTVLSPRQSVSPAPYALYAKAAGGFAVPLTATGSSDGAPSSTTGLFTVTQGGTGIAIAGNRTTTDAAVYPAVLGTNSGGGAGVQGESTHASGTGVQGFATGTSGIGGYFSGVTGAKVVSSTVSGTALEVDGPIKVSGTNPTAFVHIATSGNTTVGACLSDQCTEINNPLINGNANVILIVTQRYQQPGGVYNNAPIGVWYNDSVGRWTIFNQDLSAMPVGATFNVLVILR